MIEFSEKILIQADWKPSRVGLKLIPGNAKTYLRVGLNQVETYPWSDWNLSQIGLKPIPGQTETFLRSDWNSSQVGVKPNLGLSETL